MAGDSYCMKCGTIMTTGPAFCAACGAQAPNPGTDAPVAGPYVAPLNPVGGHWSAGTPRPVMAQSALGYSDSALHAQQQTAWQAAPPQTGVPGFAAPAGVWAGYNALPWYRKSGVLSVLAAIGILVGLAIVPVCIAVLSGPVYYKQLDGDGSPRTWGPLNKVAAIAILCVWVVVAIVKGSSS